MDQRKGEEVKDFFGTVSTYIDSDGLKGEEVLIITLESIYPTTAPSVSGHINIPFFLGPPIRSDTCIYCGRLPSEALVISRGKWDILRPH